MERRHGMRPSSYRGTRGVIQIALIAAIAAFALSGRPTTSSEPTSLVATGSRESATLGDPDRAGATDLPADLVDQHESDDGPFTPPEPQPAGPETGTEVLHVVYFVERDEDFDPESLELIAQQADRLQQFWYDQFGGTFFLSADGVEVIYGDHDAAWYDTTANGDDPRWYRLMNMRGEVTDKLQLDPADHSVRLIAYPSGRIDGRVAANRYGGAWMDGDDVGCNDGGVTSTPYTLNYPANCLATVAHELGHIYGLGHQGDDRDCMQYGFYQHVLGDELCDFSEANRSQVTGDSNNQGWLSAQPGDRR